MGRRVALSFVVRLIRGRLMVAARKIADLGSDCPESGAYRAGNLGKRVVLPLILIRHYSLQLARTLTLTRQTT